VRRVLRAAVRRTRRGLRVAAVRLGGLPHSEGTVDSPPDYVAHDITGLWIRNWTSSERIVDPSASEVVNLTTHGERLRDVWVAIESVGRGTALPGRIILWLDTPSRLPGSLRRLRRRGLEISHTAPGNGVHTKYWPYVSTQPLHRPLVLCDDDIIYPPTWLAGLRRRYEESDGRTVIAYRTHTMTMLSPQDFAPYTSWPPGRGEAPSYCHFATTVSGQLLPPYLQGVVRGEGTAFLDLSPTNDDIWLHRCAVAAAVPTAQVAEHPQHWFFIPGSQTSGLNAVNVHGGANDVQFAAVHTPVTRGRIWACADQHGTRGAV